MKKISITDEDYKKLSTLYAVKNMREESLLNSFAGELTQAISEHEKRFIDYLKERGEKYSDYVAKTKTHKICIMCVERGYDNPIKPLEDFPVRQDTRDGRYSYCKSCHRKRMQEIKERKRQERK